MNLILIEVLKQTLPIFQFLDSLVQEQGVYIFMVCVFVQLAVGEVERFAQERAARRAADDGVRIIVGQFGTESCATGTQPRIGGGSGNGSAAGEQAENSGQQTELKE